jgi:hypothetical protein
VQKVKLTVRTGPRVGGDEGEDIVENIEEDRSMEDQTLTRGCTIRIASNTLIKDHKIAIRTEAEEMAEDQDHRRDSATCADTMGIGGPTAQTGRHLRMSTEDPEQT